MGTIYKVIRGNYDIKKLTFTDYVSLIQEFLKTFNVTYQEITPSIRYKSQDLYGFIRKTRHKYEDGKLSKKKETIMRALGETFPYPYVPTEEIYQILSSYMEESKVAYSDIKEGTYYHGYELFHLIKSIRRRKSNNELTFEQSNKFLNMGEKFLCMNILKLSEIIKRYLQETSTPYQDIANNDCYEGYDLYYSLERARNLYWNNRLTIEEENSLRKLGEQFYRKVPSYEFGINLIRKILQTEQIIIKDIKKDYIFEQYRIGEFLDNLRETYHEGKLPKHRQKVLNKLGEDFSNVRPGFYPLINTLGEYMHQTNTPINEIPTKAVCKGRNLDKAIRKCANLYIQKSLTSEEQLMLLSLRVDLASRLTTIKSLQKYYSQLAIRLYERKAKTIIDSKVQVEIEDTLKRILK